MRLAHGEEVPAFGSELPKQKPSPEKPKLRLIQGGESEESEPTANEKAIPEHTRAPEHDDWVWKNRIEDTKAGKRVMPRTLESGQTPEESVEELRRTIQNNEWDKKINQAHGVALIENLETSAQKEKTDLTNRIEEIALLADTQDRAYMYDTLMGFTKDPGKREALLHYIEQMEDQAWKYAQKKANMMADFEAWKTEVQSQAREYKNTLDKFTPSSNIQETKPKGFVQRFRNWIGGK